MKNYGSTDVIVESLGRTACEDHDPHRHGRSLGIYVIILTFDGLLDEVLRAMPPPQDRHLDIPARVSRRGSTRVILATVGVVRKRHAGLSEDMHKHQNQPGSGGAYAGGLQTSSVGRLPNRKPGVVPLRPLDRTEVTLELNSLRFEIPDEEPPRLISCDGTVWSGPVETECAQSRWVLADWSADEALRRMRFCVR